MMNQIIPEITSGTLSHIRVSPLKTKASLVLCKCKFRTDDFQCGLVAKESGLPICHASTSEDACRECCMTSTPSDGTLNSVIASLVIHNVSIHERDRVREVLHLYRDVLVRDQGQPSGKGKPHRKVELAKRYAEAIKRWHDAGRPIRSDEEVERIYTDICMNCKHFKRKKDGSGSCRACGCRLRRNKRFAGVLDALENKIRMATEHCWRGYW